MVADVRWLTKQFHEGFGPQKSFVAAPGSIEAAPERMTVKNCIVIGRIWCLLVEGNLRGAAKKFMDK